MKDTLARLFEDSKSEAAAWCAGKNWVVRLPILLWFSYILFRYFQDPFYSSLMSALNLGLHELGHLLFSPLGSFLGILGGTLTQIIGPLLGAVNFYIQRDYFAIMFSLGWLSTSLFDAARYVADARAMSLPLVSPFGYAEAPVHDWNYLLSRLGLLPYDGVIAFFIRCAAFMVMGACLVGGSWLLLQMKQRESPVS